VTATGTSSPFSKALSGLSAGTPYYYKAYIVEGGQEVLGAEESFTTKAVATATVTTTAATGVTYSSATLNASFTGASGTITDRGFRFKKGSGSWETPTGLGSISGTSGSFSMEISSLDSESTYTFQAYVTEWDEEQNQYVDHWASSAQTFTTSAQSSQLTAGWLELPALTGSEDFVGKFYGSGSTLGTNRNYSYNYSYTYYASMWVAYPLCSTHKNGSASTSSWRYNPNIANNKQVNIINNSYGTMYGEDGYARGHQCPNASRKSDDNMNLQTYYATNQTPQLQNKFNGSIWGSLETAVRNLATSSSDTVYVVTGPAYRKVGVSETINYLHGASGKNANPSELPIPNYYWKALLKVKRDGSGNITSAKTIGFWFDHRNYESSEHYYDSEHVVSVNQIETWTGLNLFHNLPGDDNSGIEQTAEANTSWTQFQSF